MRIKKAVLITFAVLLLASRLMAQDEAARDDIILMDAVDSVAANIHYTIFDNVEVEVADGVVFLSGHVTMPYKKSSYEREIIKAIPDVARVENQIEVLPVNIGDDQLRRQIARRIYNDSRLLRYAIEPFPRSIHIIVKHGQVYLEGAVANKLDSMLVYINARSVFGVLKVHNNLQIL